MESQTFIQIFGMTFLLAMVIARLITFWHSLFDDTHLATVSWNG
ncbi:MAG TPA: hypothetical protein VK206_06635 [Anaerolineales bacterium]|nr:hypothetical protein [Anaerolineales bacterium]